MLKSIFECDIPQSIVNDISIYILVAVLCLTVILNIIKLISRIVQFFKSKKNSVVQAPPTLVTQNNPDDNEKIGYLTK